MIYTYHVNFFVSIYCGIAIDIIFIPISIDSIISHDVWIRRNFYEFVLNMSTTDYTTKLVNITHDLIKFRKS